MDVDGYSENSTRSTALTFDNKKRDSKRLGAGLQGKYRITPQTQVFGEYAYEREYDDDVQKVNIALNSLPSLDFRLEGYTPQSHLNRLSLGVSHKLTADLALRGGYTLRKDDDFTQQGINIGVALELLMHQTAGIKKRGTLTGAAFFMLMIPVGAGLPAMATCQST